MEPRTGAAAGCTRRHRPPSPPVCACLALAAGGLPGRRAGTAAEAARGRARAEQRHAGPQAAHHVEGLVRVVRVHRLVLGPVEHRAANGDHGGNGGHLLCSRAGKGGGCTAVWEACEPRAVQAWVQATSGQGSQHVGGRRSRPVALPPLVALPPPPSRQHCAGDSGEGGQGRRMLGRRACECQARPTRSAARPVPPAARPPT